MPSWCNLDVTTHVNAYVCSGPPIQLAGKNAFLELSCPAIYCSMLL